MRLGFETWDCLSLHVKYTSLITNEGVSFPGDICSGNPALGMQGDMKRERLTLVSVGSRRGFTLCKHLAACTGIPVLSGDSPSGLPSAPRNS